MSKEEKVLLVDDDEFLLDMYSLKFKDAGFNIEVAESGEEALEKIKGDFFPIILLDVVMPSTDGFEVLRKIKSEKLADKSVIVILSNLGQKEDIERGMKMGADDYIIKAHHTPHEVVEKVQHLLAK